VGFLFFPFPDQMALQYSKQPLSHTEQLELLEKRGLFIEDKCKAQHLLKNISYYRLSGYWHPLLQSPKHLHQFKENASFNTAFKLYCFDRELRQLVLGEIEKIEVAVKSQMINTLATAFGPFWHTDRTLFRNYKNRHDKFLQKISDEATNCQEEFIQAFNSKYADPYPPCWMTLEIASFGQISTLYSDLNPGRSKRAIAHHFGLKDPIFKSWLHTLVYLRNLCAHHSRFWNRKFGVSPKTQATYSKPWLSPNSPALNTSAPNSTTFVMLSILLYLLQTVNPKSTFKTKFLDLTRKYPNVDLGAMGFPSTWTGEPLWR